jgi:ATP-dependent exoDNAse (exonuclease V) beta subunit
MFQRWRVVDFDDGSKTEFDPLRDQLLLFELKQLYVAVTRARTNLWIYDQSERGAAVRAILQERQLVTTLKKASNGEVPLRLAKRSTPEEWNQAGLRFFSQDCFEVRVISRISLDHV